jgi:hypothetical protein
MKTLAQAVAVRDRILAAYERAAEVTDPQQRRRWTTFVIVGGGPPVSSWPASWLHSRASYTATSTGSIPSGPGLCWWRPRRSCWRRLPSRYVTMRGTN